MSNDEYSFEKIARKRLGKPKLIARALISPLKFFIIFMPDVAGYGIRRLYYKSKLNYMGKGVLIDVGVIILNPDKVSIGNYTWIDRYVSIEGLKGVSIGKHVHIGPYSLIQGGGYVKVGDYVGIGSHSKIYSSSESYEGGKRMSGPMVPPEHRNVIGKPIIIKNDAFLGVGTTVLPGVKIGEGAVIGAHSLVLSNIPPWTIAAGTPAKPIKKRPRLDLRFS